MIFYIMKKRKMSKFNKIMIYIAIGLIFISIISSVVYFVNKRFIYGSPNNLDCTEIRWCEDERTVGKGRSDCFVEKIRCEEGEKCLDGKCVT